MTSAKRILIFVAFIGATGAMLLGKSILPEPKSSRPGGAQTAGGAAPAQNELPDVAKPLFVEFYSQGCDICRSLAPTIKYLNKKYSDKVEFVLVDTDDPANAQLSEQFNVNGLPTMYWLTIKREVMEAKEGYQPPEDIEKLLQHLAEVGDLPVGHGGDSGQGVIPPGHGNIPEHGGAADQGGADKPL